MGVPSGRGGGGDIAFLSQFFLYRKPGTTSETARHDNLDEDFKGDIGSTAVGGLYQCSLNDIYYLSEKQRKIIFISYEIKVGISQTEN